MSSGADLFVVCKQCGSEVSPYITECPYCGNRLRRRAPKLPRAGARTSGWRRSRMPSLSRLRKGEIPGIRAEAQPYVTIVLVLASCVMWVLIHGGYVGLDRTIVLGSLHGDWWRLLSSQFVYINGFYAFAALLALAIFGWLLERRRGPLVVAALYLGAGAAGAIAALAVERSALVTGGGAGALALLGAWAAPDALAAARRRGYEADLLGTAVFAAVLLAMPLARIEVSPIADVCGLVIGLLVGCGLASPIAAGD